VRVIAGRLGGRTLVAPRGSSTRPTADRVREALFSILGPLENARVLDLYAGTGALGIEAISRGALRVTFVEHERAAQTALHQNLRALALGELAEVLPRRVEQVLRSPPWGDRVFDLVLADPPYAMIRDGRLAEIARLGEGALARSVRPGGRLVLEQASADAAPPLSGFRFVETRRYGDTAIGFYVCEAEPQGEG
jgi:16S rRNA (guanine966-N2)-methyltransferase